MAIYLDIRYSNGKRLANKEFASLSAFRQYVETRKNPTVNSAVTSGGPPHGDIPATRSGVTIPISGRDAYSLPKAALFTPYQPPRATPRASTPTQARTSPT